MKTFILFALFITLLPLYAKTYQLIDQKGMILPEGVRVVENRKALMIDFSVAQMHALEKKGITPIKEKFQQIKFDGLELTTDVGLAALPFYSVLVRGKPEQLKIKIDQGPVKRFKAFNPLPAPNPKQRCGQKCAQEDFNIDWNRYFSPQKHSFYRVEYLGTFRGTDVSRVLFYPARYFGNEKSLEIYPQISYQIRSLVGSQVIHFGNPGDLLGQRELGNRYLIIAPEKFHQALAEFVEWKEELGYEVDLIGLEKIGNKYTKIKEFIQNRYHNEETTFTYALLVGDALTLATGYANTSSSSYTPSDLHYFTMDGANDFIPDAFYGRMVATEVSHVETQVAKILEYEQGEFDDDPARFRQLGIASNEGFAPSDKDYVQMMATPLAEAFGTDVSYIFQSGGGSYYDYVHPNTYFSKGLAWINYIGHGMGDYWASMDRSYYSIYVKEIKPGHMKPIIIDVACLNGNFRYNGRMLGERFMNSTNNGEPVGAVAYYGASVKTSWDPPAIMAVGISKMVVHFKFKSLGQALFGGQIYLYKNYSNSSEVVSNLRWYHLFGDPSLQIRLGDL